MATCNHTKNVKVRYPDGNVILQEVTCELDEGHEGNHQMTVGEKHIAAWGRKP